MWTKRRALLLALALCLAASAPPYPGKPRLDRETKAALERISAASVQGHLSFLASDLLEGRATPSRGLDLAAEYIAAQFRRAGLEPGGNEGYFQTTTVTARGAETPEKVKNVIGVLRGADPALNETCVIVSGHYDHLGVRPQMEGDNLYNGANDDASGTVGVIELAAALAAGKRPPRRSVVFIAFFGEERGLLGSRHYGKNPVFPIDKTIAHINLEQIGRTDDTEGPRVAELSMTGFDFSDIGPLFAAAGKAVGVAVTKHPRNSDAFFGRSDNQALADLGVPAHTLCTAFIFPDYHRAGDHWDKIDAANMAKVLQAIALGVWTLAQTSSEPRWNEANPKAERYVKAWQERRPLPNQ